MSQIKAVLAGTFVSSLDRLALRTVTVLGDSHAHVFRHHVFKVSFPLTRFDICSVNGATAAGLENPNSKTQAGPIFARKLETVRAGLDVIVLLGEIDTGFLIWHRARRLGVPVADTLEQALQAYRDFLAWIGATWRLTVVSAPLPTIEDTGALGDVANLRKEIAATQIQRTQLARRFNAAVERFCVEQCFACVNLDAESLGAEGLVHSRLLNTNPLDHHYSPKAYARLLCGRLRAVL